MEKKHICPICNSHLTPELYVKYTDFSCRDDAHFFSIREREDAFSKTIHKVKLKVRVGDMEKQAFVLKLNYDECTSEIWTINNGNNSDRLKINTVLNVDFSDIEKIKNKILTYLNFS